MSERVWDKSLLLTTIAVTVITAVSIWAAWGNSSTLGARISFSSLVPVLVAASTSYLLRIVRFHFFLTRSGVPISLRGTATVQAVGFALSVTPGHVGELFKLHLIRERAGTPVVQTAPLLLLDRLTEGGGFLILAIASGLALRQLPADVPVPMLVLLGIGAALLFAATRDHWAVWLSRRNLQFGDISLWARIEPHVRNLCLGIQTSFTTSQILGGLGISMVARFADGLVVMSAAHMLGMELTITESVFVLALSGLAGGMSFLPGGTGAVETAMVGLLVVFGMSAPNAFAAALLARLFTLWLWVSLGLVLAFSMRFSAVLARAKGYSG